MGECWNKKTGRSQKPMSQKLVWVQFPPRPLSFLFMPKPKLPDKEFKWTPELAYAIGLLTTDGNLSKDGRHITMRSCDIQLLNTFKKCLNLPNKISETFHNGWGKRRTYRIQFSNVQLYRWLFKIGLTPRKTYTIGELKILDRYFPDFLRGHLDGDGSITTYKDRWNTFKNPKYVYTRLWVRFISASKFHIRWLQRKINKLLGVKGHLWERKPERPDQTATIYGIKFAKKDSIRLLSWLYYNRKVPCLIRKRKIAEKFIKIP